MVAAYLTRNLIVSECCTFKLCCLVSCWRQ